MMKDFEGNEVTKEIIEKAELEWNKYWEEYCKNNKDVDGGDYNDEREMFMIEKFGGKFKHM